MHGIRRCPHACKRRISISELDFLTRVAFYPLLVLSFPRPILAIESSCDETAVAILSSHAELLVNLVASQRELHARFGGVVPEVASRNHLSTLDPLFHHALAQANLKPADLGAVVATAGPGLAPALLVGASYAKGVALGLGIPYLAVNHLEGHLLSPFFPKNLYSKSTASAMDCVMPNIIPAEAGIVSSSASCTLRDCAPAVPSPSSAAAILKTGSKTEIPKHLSLLVSGGHTQLTKVMKVGCYELLGRTHDDAAGEAFDKVGKLLGLPYPGGIEIDRLAQQGNPKQYSFPRALLEKGNLDFSFSGLKTSVRYFLEKQNTSLNSSHLADLCASFQEAVVAVLVEKTRRAAEQEGLTCIGVSGGVAANSRLRSALSELCEKHHWELHFPPPALIGDNAAMIAFAGLHRLLAGERTSVTQEIVPQWRL